jgi:hypothetical protein
MISLGINIVSKKMLLDIKGYHFLLLYMGLRIFERNASKNSV